MNKVRLPSGADPALTLVVEQVNRMFGSVDDATAPVFGTGDVLVDQNGHVITDQNGEIVLKG